MEATPPEEPEASGEEAPDEGPGERPDSPVSPSRLDRFAHPLAWLIAIAFLLPLIGKSGIWDPYELDVAELSRRVAVNVWGASELALAGAENGLPTLTDLKMGELPFTSMGLGFKLFGLHDWSGRLPLALFGLAGAIAVYHFLARLIAPRAGLFGVIALVTMPLYFMQARTMLGDIVTMTAFTMAFCGLVGALLDESKRALLAWLAVSSVGLLAGYLSRGLLIGVAAPLLSCGLAWVVVRAGARGGENGGVTLRSAVGATSLLLGAGALAIFLRTLESAEASDPLRRVLGFTLLEKAPLEATFDRTIRSLGHALFPWSAVLPFAIGRMFRAPVEVFGDAARTRETAVRTALIVGLSVAFTVFALLTPYAGALPFAAPALLAAVLAIAIVDLDRGAAASRAIAFGVVLLGLVLYADLTRMPDKALSVFYVDRPTFPKSFEEASVSAMRVVLVMLLVLALAWFEAQPKALMTDLRRHLADRRAELANAAREVGEAWSGNLAFSLIVVWAALVGLGAMLFFGGRLGWTAVTTLPKNFADTGVNLWWAVPLALGLAMPAALALRDGFSLIVRASRLSRASWVALAALGAAVVQAFFYYPALAEQLSPKEVFESYATLGAGQPLGLLGVQSRVGAYYDAGEVETFADATRAHRWLVEEGAPRRWLVVKAEDLPKLNAMYRKDKGQNLPVLDGRSSQISLVSSELGDHKNESWIESIVIPEEPKPLHAVDAMFEDQLEVIGWEVRDESDAIVTSVVPQTPYRMRFYYRVQKPITGTWKAFMHIDGFSRRFNGDHAVVDGKYPMSLWQPGDRIVDDVPFELEPNFTPGIYTVYFGFFAGEARFSVTRGPNQENRVVGGPLEVR